MIYVDQIDSWSSSSTSSREGLPQADPTSWAKQDLDEASNRSPVVDVSSSLTEEPHAFAVAGNEEGANDTTSLHKPITAPNEQSTASNPKRKARTAFSEVQMNALVQRFSVQRYLTPAEMKNLAELTGLTYKQVRNQMGCLDHK